MLSKLRENIVLKVIAILAATLLWAYVKAERTPVTRSLFLARVVPRDVPPNVDPKSVPTQINVAVTGQAPAVQALKDADIQAVLDMKSISPDAVGTVMIRPTVILPDTARGLVAALPAPVRIQVRPQQHNEVAVVAIYPKEPPAGFHYARPEIQPPYLTVSGSAEKLAQVERAVVHAAPPEPGTSIDGEFPVQIWDSDNNPVDGVHAKPDMVRLKVALVEEPASKEVTVSPSIIDQPRPPYILNSITVRPNQVRITGRPEKLGSLATLQTEDISLAQVTGSQTVDATLAVPPDVTAHDETGRRINHVEISISVRKLSQAPAPANQTPAPATPTPAPQAPAKP